MWPNPTSTPSSGGSGTPYRPFESTFDDFRPNPFPSPEPPVPPPTSLSLSPPPLGGVVGGPLGGNNNNWSLSPPAEDKPGTSSTVVSPVEIEDTVSWIFLKKTSNQF